MDEAEQFERLVCFFAYNAMGSETRLPRDRSITQTRVDTMTATDIAKQAISRINKRITDEVFLEIQNNRELMHHYLRAVEKDGLDTVNRCIAKQVKESYGLDNEDREHNPSSTLIQSHQKFK